MTNIRDFFNIFLLSISLATVFVTLASYIVFKIRYSFQTKTIDGVKKLEGAYFRRYAPEIEAKNTILENAYKKRQTKRLSPTKRLVAGFSIIAAFIFLVLAAENYFSFRSQLKERATSAQEMRSLIEKGLIKKIEPDLTKSQVELNEFISPYKKSYKASILAALKKQSVYLIKDPTNFKEGQDNHIKSYNQWYAFLKRNNISFRVINVYTLPKKGIVIGPHLTSLSQKKREILQKANKDKKVSFIFTGFPGTLLSKDEESPQLLPELDSTISISQKTEQEKYLPTQLIGINNQAPGLLLENYPINNNYKAVFSQGVSLARASNYYTQRPLFDNSTRAQLISNNLAWSEVDPSPNKLEDPNGTTLFHEDLLFLNLLYLVSNSARIEVAPWKLAKNKSAVILSVDTEKDFERIDYFMDLFNDFNMQATFFLVSDLLKSYKGDLKSKSEFEFASHSLEHKPLTKEDFLENFTTIMQSRFDIELRTHKKVEGFRPPEEKIDEESAAAILQNEIFYILGPKRQLSFSPFLINKGENVFIPRTLRDDVNFLEDKLLSGPETMVNELKADFTWTKEAKGLYALSLHTHILGNEIYKVMLSDFMEWLKEQEENTYITTALEIARWYKFKENLKIARTPNGFTISNDSDLTVDSFDVILSNLESECGKESVNESKKNKETVITVKAIKPGETQPFPLCAGTSADTNSD